jgi:hypothetical protein
VTFAKPDQLIEVLRATILQVEQTSGVSADDPALIALRRIVLQRIADIELAKAAELASPKSSFAIAPSAEATEVLPISPIPTEVSE